MSLSERIAVIDKGEIQQCGTPLEVYTTPANIFVAGFIGSPPMNFIDAIVLRSDPFTIAINNIVFNPAIKNIPKADKVILGVRPEDVMVFSIKEEGEINAIAEITELEGPIMWVKMNWNGISIKGKMSYTDTISAGAEVYFKIPDNKIHIFDYNSGARLC